MELGRVTVTFINKAILFCEGDQSVPIRLEEFLEFKKALRVLYTNGKQTYIGKVHNLSAETIVFYRVISFKLSDSDCHVDFYHHHIPKLCKGIIEYILLCLDLGSFDRVLLENLKCALIKLRDSDRKELLREIRNENNFVLQKIAEETVRNSSLE